MLPEQIRAAIAPLIDKKEENKKLVAWGNYGVQLYHADLELQVRAQDIVNKLITSITPELIQEAEAAVAIVKKEKEALKKDRIAITTARFDPVTNRLMQSEKSIEAAIAINEAAILKAKQDKRNAAALDQDKIKEQKQIIEHIRLYITDMNTAFLSAQAKLLKDAYEYALNNGIQDGEPIKEYIGKLQRRVTVENHTMPKPVPSFKYNTKEIVDKLVEENFKPISGQEYVNSFRLDLNDKFKDWDLALKNTHRASELNTEEFNQTVDAITDLKDKETIAAKLETIAVPMVESDGVKPLKEVFKIDVSNLDIPGSFVIMNAFLINRALTEPQLRKINPLNLSVKQMIAALEAIKNNDNEFSCTGIDFIIVDKL